MSRSENIHVSLRFRPLNSKEIEENESMIWAITQTTVSLKPEWSQYFLDYKRLARMPKAYNYSIFLYRSLL